MSATKHRYVPPSSRATRNVTTLLAQVEDLERGQRIKARREELRLTQPAVVDLMADYARDLPETHALNPMNPARAGKPPVTLRGYQAYELGGGIRWEKAKLLARALQTDPEWVMNGTVRQSTPDPFDGAPVASEGQVDEMAIEFRGHVDGLADDLRWIKRSLATAQAERNEMAGLIDEQSRALEEQATVLGELRDTVRELAATVAIQQSAARELDDVARRLADAGLVPAPEDGSARRGRGRSATASTGNQRASK